MIENGTLLQDRYLIERRIGVGGMGAVYLAVDRRFENYVAIKETFYKDDEFSEAFEREAHLLNSLMHPVLPHVSDYFTENEGHFLVMQFIEGEDLSEILKLEGAFPVKDVLRWVDNLLDGLDYLHSQEPPIIHRDIKPQNLKLTPRGDIILLDFGLAKLNHEDTTGVKSVFGYSRKYSPLEQIQGTGTDARSDIFALGATAYQLLTGKPPLDALTRASAIVAGNPDPLPLASEINDEIPVEIAHILHSALKLNADQRFASANAMRQALAHAVNAESSENIEEEREQVLTAAPAEVINSAETESFPALEAFAAEVAIAAPAINIDKQIDVTDNPNTNYQMPLTATKNLTQATDVPTRVTAKPKRKQFSLAALAALLIGVSLVAGYFINNSDTPVAANSSIPVEQTAAEQNPVPEETTAEEAAADSDMEILEDSELPAPQDVEQVKVKSPPIEKPIEKKEVVEEAVAKIETAEKPQPAPVRNTRRSQSERNGETRERIIDSEPIPDIEAVFTGRPAGDRGGEATQSRKNRRGHEEMTDEEWREMRRQRRQRRLERQNRQNFPF